MTTKSLTLFVFIFHLSNILISSMFGHLFPFPQQLCIFLYNRVNRRQSCDDCVLCLWKLLISLVILKIISSIVQFAERYPYINIFFVATGIFEPLLPFVFTGVNHLREVLNYLYFLVAFRVQRCFKYSTFKK